MSDETTWHAEGVHEIAGALLERVDWDRLAAGRELGLAAAVFLRRHPWLLVAAGATLTALGVYALLKEAAAERDRQERALLELPARKNGVG